MPGQRPWWWFRGAHGQSPWLGATTVWAAWEPGCAVRAASGDRGEKLLYLSTERRRQSSFLF